MKKWDGGWVEKTAKKYNFCCETKTQCFVFIIVELWFVPIEGKSCFLTPVDANGNLKNIHDYLGQFIGADRLKRFLVTFL